MKKKFETSKSRGFLLEALYSENGNIYLLKDLQGILIKSSENFSDLTEFVISESSIKEFYKRKFEEQKEFNNFVQNLDTNQ